MTGWDWESVVTGIMLTAGVDRDRAEETARLNGHTPPTPDPAEARRIERAANVREKAEQAEVVKRFRVCGFTSYNLSQARASKQTPGLPDLVFLNAAAGVGCFWETKRSEGGRFSEAQLRFAAEARASEMNYGAGDRHAAEDWLIAHRLAYRVRGVFTPKSRGQSVAVVG